MTFNKDDDREHFWTSLCCLAARGNASADQFLATGEAVSVGLEHGFPIENIARALRMSVCECLLARDFSNCSPAFKFEALVERWGRRKVIRAMRGERTTQISRSNHPAPTMSWEPTETRPFVGPTLTSIRAIEAPFSR